MLKPLQTIKNLLNDSDYSFPFKMWLFSRFLIGFATLFLTPLLSFGNTEVESHVGWGAFAAWDSGHYKAIVFNGYSYANDGQGYNVAFFPLFPLLIRLLMQLGLPFEVAGTLLNSVAFLGALLIFHRWITKNYTLKIAQWSTAILAWCPFSLFCTVIYTEGVFLFLSVSALVLFQQKKYILASIFGALSTATRVTGIALIPTFFLAAWQEKRGFFAYLSSFLSGLGILAYCVYCWLEFNEPLAFIKVQKAWTPQDQVFWGSGWLKMLSQLIFGFTNTKQGSLKDPSYLIMMGLIMLLAYGLWHFREKLGSKVDYGCFFLIFLLWIVSGNPFINISMVVGGVYLLWNSRKKLSSVDLFYGIFSFMIIFSSGRSTSAERYTYAIVPLSLALGIILDRYPRWGYALTIFFGFLLLLYSIRFAQNLWVA